MHGRSPRASRGCGREAGIVAAGFVAVLGIGLAACGSTAAKPTTTSTTVTTTLPPAASSKPAIEQSYSVLFNLSDPAIDPKLAVVQDGASLRAAFAQALKSPLAKLAGGAKVLSIGPISSGRACSDHLEPSPCAEVVYDILSPKHKVLLAKAAGFAIYVHPKWLVAKSTICTLLTLDNNGQAPPGC